MEKTRSSPLAFLFPWLAPLVIKFAIMHGGIEVQLYQNDQLLKDWHPSNLRRVLPEPLTKWIEDCRIHMGPQPYPLIKQLWQHLIPLTSKKLIIDAAVLAELEEVSQPENFALIWRLNCSKERIEGHYEGVDHYLGMGWFQKGTKTWLVNTNPANPTYTAFENLIVPIQQTDFLLKSIIPYLQRYLPTRIDFWLITNFIPQVVVSEVRIGALTLALQCNYPQLLPIVQIPQQKVDLLLTSQAMIYFPRQALTHVMIQLLQKDSSITIQGVGVPLFIREQLPIMRQHSQISDEMAAKITQANPIVSIATLKPTDSLSHTSENGIGKYSTTATYSYQQHPIDMDVLLAAPQQKQRFAQQHGSWFEWPNDPTSLVNDIRQRLARQVLLPEEVMGLATRRIAFLPNQPIVPPIQPTGTTPFERSQSVFEQLRHHGIPGGIVGSPAAITTMFIDVCEKLLRTNRQARMLWLVPSSKKGSVTRSINIYASKIGSYVTVASLVTLRDEPALLSHDWTLIIFQDLNLLLLDQSPQRSMLPQLKWQWALTSVTSMKAFSPFIAQVLHIPEQYHEQFCLHCFVNLEKSYLREATNQPLSRLHTIQPTPPIEPKKDHAPQTPASAPQTPRITIQLKPAAKESFEQPIRQAIELNQKKIVRLHEESSQLQDRLTVEEDDEEQPPLTPMSNPVPITPVIHEIAETAPEVDEDWQLILQQWQPEHWEIITLLYQEHSAPLATVERKVHRPISRLIDEINHPVDETLGDLLVDPDTHTIFPHFHPIAANLVHWYLSSKGRETLS